MRIIFRSLLLLVPILALFAACGGGDDDDSSADDDDSTSSSKNDDNGSSGSSANVVKVKDGQFGEGSLKVEVSGDKDFKLDVKGSGLATGGFTLLTFLNEEASVILAFQPDDEDEKGAISLTTNEMSTSGEWGADCSLEMEDGATELKGEFDCKDVEGVEPRSAESLELRVKGTFSLPR